MKLSEIVAFKNQLDSIKQIALIKLTADIELLKIIYLAENQYIVDKQYIDNLLQTRMQLHTSFDNMHIALTQFVQQIEKSIAEKEIEFYQKSYGNYWNKILNNDRFGYYDKYVFVKTTMQNAEIVLPAPEKRLQYAQDTNTIILNNQLALSDNVFDTIKGRITAYASWKYPAAVFRPTTNPFMNIMVASDPLYLIDDHSELLTLAVNKFGEAYQNRLRQYITSEYAHSILNKLPNNQFTFFLIYNYFDLKPIEFINRYLEELYQKLRPGGTIGMTFNNCNKSNAVIQAEKGLAYYTPGNIVLSIAKNIGFQQVFYLDDSGPTTWVELQKPGNLTSIRGGQTLAKIHHK